MPRFERLTVEEARTLSRNQLLPRIEAEQKYWYGLLNSGRMRVGDDEAFKAFNRILRVAVDPGHPAPGPDAFLGGEADDGPSCEQDRDLDHWTKPLGELGHL
ncbi:hypothetical protein [Planobispora takensis]|uniref:Uncharacterized protein n=1 Tax=Planobispora takensis TaxID=1367882 RepID=A0A8J3T750_9ACTN|nr:hypothetical protein [Planobispora takensis]GII05445.1 hypothetical protein Pta02_74530 [Planobispora takensis]